MYLTDVLALAWNVLSPLVNASGRLLGCSDFLWRHLKHAWERLNEAARAQGLSGPGCSRAGGRAWPSVPSRWEWHGAGSWMLPLRGSVMSRGGMGSPMEPGPQQRAREPPSGQAVGLDAPNPGTRPSALTGERQREMRFYRFIFKKQKQRLKKSFISNPAWGCGWEENRLRRAPTPAGRGPLCPQEPSVGTGHALPARLLLR